MEQLNRDIGECVCAENNSGGAYQLRAPGKFFQAYNGSDPRHELEENEFKRECA